MKLLVSAWLVCVALLLAAPGRAQLGELQIGATGAYGSGEAFGPGVGLVLGVAPGRLAYVGLRWTYYLGDTQLRGATPSEVRTRTQVVAVDLGIQIPAGTLEIVPGVSVGWSQFTQRARQPNASGSSHEFLAAPGVAVELHVGRLALIPEMQYYLAGSPKLPWRVNHRGFVVSARLVFLSEIRRIRR
jgi:hypothetical protein